MKNNNTHQPTSRRVTSSVFLFSICAGLLAACNLPNLGNYDPYASIPRPAPLPTVTEALADATATATEPAPNVCTVTAYVLHLRTGAGISHKVIGYLYAGDVLTIQSQRGTWLKVRTPANVIGWVHGAWCKR